jgi:hypothetical protein
MAKSKEELRREPKEKDEIINKVAGKEKLTGIQTEQVSSGFRLTDKAVDKQKRAHNILTEKLKRISNSDEREALLDRLHRGFDEKEYRALLAVDAKAAAKMMSEYWENKDLNEI